MKINQNVKIIGENVILVPYEAKHVEKYHNWMKCKELQELTGSEPLTLEQEYEMQQSWRNDDDKCTFLILSKKCYEENNNEIEALIGDTNLFIATTEELHENSNEFHKIAEAEIMIAEKSYRQQHLGWESILLMLKYGQETLKIHKFIVKIKEQNTRSIQMFKKIQFIEESYSQVFQEITLARLVNNAWVLWLNEQIQFKIEHYP